MGSKFQLAKFQVCINPFGTTYNPLSLAWQLERLGQERSFGEQDVRSHGRKCFSFQHHTKFTSTSTQETLQLMNQEFMLARQSLLSADFLFLTLGSAWAFTLRETGEVVSNCHKLPQLLFSRKIVSASEASEALKDSLKTWMSLNPKLRIIITVSPVRHWKDGAVENSRSKANLIVTAHELMAQLPNKVFYFPSYEIVMDDLRDYRYYQDDLLHPTNFVMMEW